MTASTAPLLAFLDSIGCLKYSTALQLAGMSTVESLAQATDDCLLEAGIPLGPAMKMISEVQKHRLREMLAGRKEELYFEQNFPEGSEARKVWCQRRLLLRPGTDIRTRNSVLGCDIRGPLRAASCGIRSQSVFRQHTFAMLVLRLLL